MKNWKNLTHITVKSAYVGEISHYDTLEEAVRKTGWEVIGRRLRRPGSLGYRPLDRWVIAHIADMPGDAFAFYADGIYIPSWKVKEVATHLGMGYYTYRSGRGKFKFRDGPVEGIGRSCYRNWWRHPSTYSERRDTSFHERYDEDCAANGVNIRGGRKCKSLPTSWDDIPYADRSPKSWKNYRKTQYKGV